MRRRRTIALLVVVAVSALSGCSGGQGPAGSAPAPSARVAQRTAASPTPTREPRGSRAHASGAVRRTAAASPSPTPTTRPSHHRAAGVAGTRRRTSGARSVLDRMTEAQRVGQLFMVGTPASGPSAVTGSQIRRYHVGSIILTGRSHGGTSAPRHVARVMQAAATRGARGVGLLVSTDQEGGAVQVLSGPGIASIPSARSQGQWSVGRLRAAARRWARQLRASGVNMDLAPVMDTVPGPAAARRNAPIGAYHREYGFTPRVVAEHGTAFALAMARHGIAPTVKHFPGLGRVRGNTDYSSGVTDRATGRHDPYLRPFEKAIEAGVPFVMMSTAYYERLDPNRPAAFSPVIIESLLRRQLGFRGVVVSDDLSVAQQVSGWSYGQRAVRFVAAGGDLVLVVDPAALPPMYHAVLRRARHRPAFRASVNRAALLVLRAKQRMHLLGSAFHGGSTVRQPPAQ